MKNELFWSIQFEFTEGCCLRCPFCAISSIRPKGSENKYNHMDPELLRSICKELNVIKNNPRIEIDNHGEPLLNPNALEMIGIIREEIPYSSIQLQTNGQVLFKSNETFIDNLINSIRNCFRMGLNQYVFDAYTLSLYNLTKSNLQKIKDEIIKEFPDFKLTDFYYDNPEKLNMYHKRDDHVFYLVDDLERVAEKGVVPRSKLILNEGGGTPDSYQEEHGLKLKEPLKKACSRVFREITFGWNGVVPACCYDWKNELIMGKYPEMSVKDIWNSKSAKAMKFLMSTENKFRNMTPCSVCNYGGGFRLGFLPKPSYEGGVNQALKDLKEEMIKYKKYQYPGNYHINGEKY